MKVFGIGLNKTGTTSLGRALKILGFTKHLSGNLELTKLWGDNNLAPILALAKTHNNFEDWPWPLLYKELDDEFEDAKFILTLRKSPEIWYESLCKHSLRTGPTFHRKLIYGTYMPQDFKDEYLLFYENHINNIKEYFKNKPNKLLVLSIEDENSWEKICNFLGKDIPDIDFPNINKSDKKPKIEDTETIRNKYLIKIIRGFKKFRKK